MSEFYVADDIVKSFIVDSEACVILDITKEAEDLLAIDLTKEQIRYFSLKEMGCSYCYWHEWHDGPTWLKHVLLTIQQT